MNLLFVLSLLCVAGHVIGQDQCITNVHGCGRDNDIVAFSMGSAANFDPTAPSLIPLEVTLYNEEGHFADGKFTAPTGGVYRFSFSATSKVGFYTSLHMYTEKPGASSVVRARAFGHSSQGTYDNAAGSVILRMDRGEIAELWSWGNSAGNWALYGNDKYGPSTLFSGERLAR